MAAAAATKNDLHTLFSKADIAKIMGMTTQGLANTISRDANFPKPTYSNASGEVALYSKDDVVRIHEHMTRADRERIERLNKAMEDLNKSAEPKAPAKTRGSKAAAAAEPVQVEGQTAIEDAEGAKSAE